VEPVIGVLALQGDVREHLTALAACGARAVPVRRPAELAAVDGLVLPGGESTTMSRLLGVFDLLDPLRARIAAGLPVYGSCAGLVLLAREVRDGRPDQQQLGGLDVVVRRNAFGRQVDSFEADLDVAALGETPFPAVFIRAPVVEEVGPGVEVLAAVDGRPVLCRQGRVIVAAFHPELSGDDRLHRQLLILLSDSADESPPPCGASRAPK
jgi:5'-phosphate synthase pdxT subunit